MNNHTKVLKERKLKKDPDLFQVVNWALEHYPSGLKFLIKYYNDQLDLLASGFEIEGFSFLERAISDWKIGLSTILEGLQQRDKRMIIKGNLLIENTTRMLSYSHGDFSIDITRLTKLNDELAVSYEMSSEYSYWVHINFHIKEVK
jgi:hypothetical protein